MPATAVLASRVSAILVSVVTRSRSRSATPVPACRATGCRASSTGSTGPAPPANARVRASGWPSWPRSPPSTMEQWWPSRIRRTACGCASRCRWSVRRRWRGIRAILQWRSEFRCQLWASPWPWLGGFKSPGRPESVRRAACRRADGAAHLCAEGGAVVLLVVPRGDGEDPGWAVGGASRWRAIRDGPPSGRTCPGGRTPVRCSSGSTWVNAPMGRCPRLRLPGESWYG